MAAGSPSGELWFGRLSPEPPSCWEALPYDGAHGATVPSPGHASGWVASSCELQLSIFWSRSLTYFPTTYYGQLVRFSIKT